MVQKIQNFSKDLRLKQDVINLVKPSYVDPTSLIEREFAKNDTIYLLRDEHEQLISFFMTGDDSFDNISLTYMGLSAVKHEYKNSGLGKQVYLAQIEDSIKKQDEMKNEIWCWATTATPSAFFSVQHLWDSVSPNIEFKYSKEAFDLACKLCYRHNYEFQNDNPFVIKNVAKNTIYSEAENQRIYDFKVRKNFHLFDQLSIVEKNGDRLLMIFKLPTKEKIEALRIK